MGAGKTSVGRTLAAQLGWRFVDLDEFVEAREGRSIPEIFRLAGEPAFRQAERGALLELLPQCDSVPLVMAVGGGAFVQPENAQTLRQADLFTIFLDASVEELQRRCVPDAGGRPLFGDRFRQLYEERHPSYMQADLRINTAGLTVAEVAAEIIKGLRIEGSE